VTVNSDDMPTVDQLGFTFDCVMDDLMDMIAAGRNEEAKQLLFRWAIQIQLLQALYEVRDPAELDRLRTQLGDA